MPDKYKVEVEQRHILYWWNGVKYLIQETFTDRQDANDQKKRLEERDKEKK